MDRLIRVASGLRRGRQRASLAGLATAAALFMTGCPESDIPHGDEIPQDDPAATRAQGGMHSDEALHERPVQVEVRDGVVYLSGIVRSEEEKERAEEIARDVEGVEKVVNEIEVQP